MTTKTHGALSTIKQAWADMDHASRLMVQPPAGKR